MRYTLFTLITYFVFNPIFSQQRLSLQSGNYEGNTIIDSLNYRHGVWFVEGASMAKELPSSIKRLGYYYGGWQLWQLNQEFRGDALAKLGVDHVFYPTESEKISPGVSENNTWHVYFSSPVPGLRESGWPGIALIQCSRSLLNPIAALPQVYWIEPAPGDPVPDNGGGSSKLGNASVLYGFAAKRARGTGVTIQLNDDGDVGPHLDFLGRVNQQGASFSGAVNDHGDHIAGTLIGAGNIKPAAEGMSPEARLRVLDYSTNPASGQGFFAIPQTFVQDQVRIVNTSYSDGCNVGYTTLSRFLDEQSLSYPSLIHVFSAGNAGGSNCGYGAGVGWGNITGGHKMAKNVILVGNLSTFSQVSANSSRGPAYDGRLKPDLVAPGTGILSTSSLLGPNSYLTRSGTSMAAPMVAGLFSNLYQLYRQQHNATDPPAIILKALLLNTAEDIGLPGPDFISGYGRPNMNRASDALLHFQYTTASVQSASQWDTTFVLPPGMASFKVLIHWDDLPASVGAGLALVQDIDLELVLPDGSIYYPWVANSSPNAQALSSPAVRTPDHLNTTEQITLNQPPPGQYTVKVKGYSLPAESQSFALTWDIVPQELALGFPLGGNRFQSGDTITVWWRNTEGLQPFQVDLSTDGGNNWINLASGVLSNAHSTQVALPTSVYSRNALMRVVRGNSVSLSDSLFWITPVPPNLQMDSVCGSQVYVSWDPVPGATGYALFMPGMHFMEPIMQSSLPRALLPPMDMSVGKWLAVSVREPDGQTGLRSDAIWIPPGNSQCNVNFDASAASPSFPYNGEIPDCIASNPVAFWLKNLGTQPIYQIQAGYLINDVNTYQSSFNLGLLPGDSTLLAFPNTLSLTAGNYSMKVWVNLISDQQKFNDTLALNFSIYNSIPEQVPYYQDFNGFTLCSTQSGCENINCQLSQGWYNAPNVIHDGADWRLNMGSTPSAGTGPNQGTGPEGILSKYLYIEATSCFNKSNSVYSPCIQLPHPAVYVHFDYHFFGLHTGSLSLEMLVQGEWKSIWKKNGEYGNTWRSASCPLIGYANLATQFRFVGYTGDGYLGDIAIDGFRILMGEYKVYPVEDDLKCLGDTLWLTVNSAWPGNANQLQWNANLGTQQFSFTGAGPHPIILSELGILNGSVLDNTIPAFPFYFATKVETSPVAAFTFQEVGDGQVHFNNQVQFPGTYLWQFGDGNSSLLNNPTHIYTQNGNYLVSLIVQNDCGSDTTGKWIEVSTVGFETISPDDASILIYPNPFQNYFTITGLQSNLLTGIQLFDMQGRLLFSQETFDSTYQVHTDSFTSGVYLLKISQGQDVFWSRVIRIQQN